MAAHSVNLTFSARRKGAKEPMLITFDGENVIGQGSFGVVFETRIVETGERVAVKKVLQNPEYQNRELRVMKSLSHRNVVDMLYHFYSKDKDRNLYLNLVMEFVPSTVYDVCRAYKKVGQPTPPLVVKLFAYQLCRGLAYIHSLGFCHRDIKPQNLLIDTGTAELKLCDFGSAKRLVRGQQNVAYICSRFYRAPELIMGAVEYTTAVDVWSAGCVVAEMMLSHPIFAGRNNTDQMVRIVKVLGRPTRTELFAMNPSFKEFKFPAMRRTPLSQTLRGVEPAGIDLVSKMLTFDPDKRLSALECCAHPYFDQLRDPATRLHHDSPLPEIFDFTEDELVGHDRLAPKLIPSWYAERQQRDRASAATRPQRRSGTDRHDDGARSQAAAPSPAPAAAAGGGGGRAAGADGAAATAAGGPAAGASRSRREGSRREGGH